MTGFFPVSVKKKEKKWSTNKNKIETNNVNEYLSRKLVTKYKYEIKNLFTFK